jgi:hypothetical protein
MPPRGFAPVPRRRPCHAGEVNVECSLPLDDEQRRHAIIAFLGAGLHQPPSPALAVEALASARRAVAAHLARGTSISEWLASQIRVHGIKENAAVLAVIEIPAYQHATAHAYAQRHPDRLKALNDLLAVLG